MAEDITTSDGMEEDSNVRVVSPGVDVGVKYDYTPQRNRRSAVARYTPEFQKEVVEFGLRNQLCVTSRKFNVTSTTVRDWTRKARRARETGDDKSNLPKYTPKFRREVAEFGMKTKQVVVCRKFNVPPSTVAEWVMKALRTRDDKVENIRGEVTPMTGDRCNKEAVVGSEFMGNLNRILVTFQEEESEIVDIARMSADDDNVGRDDINRVKIKNSFYGEEVRLQPSPGSKQGRKCDIAGYGGQENSSSGDVAMLDKPVPALAYRVRNLLDEGDKQSVVAAVQDDNVVPGSGCTPGLETGRRCEACGAVLASDETLPEHLVSIHLTIEGLCDICGEDSEDFLEHFKIHQGKSNDYVAPSPMVTVKSELLENTDFNQSYLDMNMNENTVKGETKEEVGRFVRNPFFSSSSGGSA